MTANRRTLKQAYSNPPTELNPDLRNFALGTDRQSSRTLENSVPDGTEVILPIAKIHKTFSFTPDEKPVRYYYDLNELKAWAEADLKVNGVRSAIWVRPMPGIPGEYELVAGLRRTLGSESIAKDTIPAKIFNWSDQEAYAAAFDENDQRQNFSKLEELDITLNLLAQQLEIDRQQVVSLLFQMDNAAKGKVSQDILASPAAEIVEAHFQSRGVMTWRSFVSKRLPLLRKPPEILAAIRSAQIDYTKAIEISRLKDEKQRQQLLTQAIEQQPTLEQVKQQVQALFSGIEAGEDSPASDEQEPTPAPIGDRLDTVWKQLKKAKVFENPKKKKQAEKLLSKLEALLKG